MTIPPQAPRALVDTLFIMLSFTRVLVVTLLTLSVSAAPKSGDVDLQILTNGERLARGLPPRAPRFSSDIDSPTRAGVKRGTPSGIPSTKQIKVTRADNGQSVGYISKTFVDPVTHRFGITNDPTNRLSVTIPSTGNPFDITITNGPDPSHPYLGFVIGPASNSDNLGSASLNYLHLTATARTASGSPPSPVGNAYSSQNSESSVWTIAASALTAQWINTDSTSPSTTLWYISSSDSLLALGDSVFFNSDFPGGYPVILKIV